MNVLTLSRDVWGCPSLREAEPPIYGFGGQFTFSLGQMGCPKSRLTVEYIPR